MSSSFLGNKSQTFSSLPKADLNINVSNTNTKVFKPLESNSFSTQRKNYSTENNCNSVKNIDSHPLDFYTLGKVNKSNEYQTQFEWNKGFKSTSNNILERNSLSINNKQFNDQNKTKKYSTLYDQNITENNYMNPIKVYKTFEEYKFPSYAINVGTYNLYKKKLYARDLNISQVTKGKNVSQIDFYSQRNKMSKRENLSVDNILSKNEGFPNLKKLGSNVQNNLMNNNNIINNIGNNDKKTRNKECTKINNFMKPISKSNSVGGLLFEDPNDYTTEKLQGKFFYFDKNNSQVLRDKKWWIKSK